MGLNTFQASRQSAHLVLNKATQNAVRTEKATSCGLISLCIIYLEP